MEWQEIQFGSYAMPVVLTVLLSFIYKMAGNRLKDKYKSAAAVACGMGLGILAIAYKAEPWSVVSITDHLIYGFMLGCSSVGIYELTRSTYNPRE